MNTVTKPIHHSLRWGILSGRLTVPDIAFAFWFFYPTKLLITAVLFQGNPKVGTAISSAISVFFVFLLTLMALTSGGRLRRLPRSFGIVLLFAFVAWSGISLIWTQAASLGSALGYWGVMAAEVVAAFLICSMAKLNDVTLRSLQGIALGSLLTVSVALFTGFKDQSGRLGGEEFLHPNTLGYYAAMATLSSVYLATRSRPEERRGLPWTIVTLLLFAALLATMSKTSLVAFSAATAVYLMVSNANFGKKVGALAAGFIITGLAYHYVIADYLQQYITAERGELLSTLTGRTIIWQETWYMIRDNPILGYGFMSFRDVGPQVAEVRLVHAHNEAINLWFSLGLIGLSLAVALYLVLLWRVSIALVRGRRRSAPQEVFLCAAILVFALLMSIAEARLVGLNTSLLPLLLLLFLWVYPRAQGNES